MVVKTKVRRWGNSFGVTIPKEVADKMHIHEDEVVFIEVKKTFSIKDAFGSHKFKRPTRELMKEIDEGWSD